MIRREQLIPLFFMLDAEPVTHTKVWGVNFFETMARIADQDLTTLPNAGNYPRFCDDDVYSLVYTAAEHYVSRWAGEDVQAKYMLSEGLRKADSLRLCTRFVEDNYQAYLDGRTMDNLLPNEDFVAHVNAVHDKFRDLEKSGGLARLPDAVSLRIRWCNILRYFLKDPACDQEFLMSQAAIYENAKALQTTMEKFLIRNHDKHDLIAFDILEAQRFFDVEKAFFALEKSNLENADDLLDYMALAIELRNADRPRDIQDQFKLLMKVPCCLPRFALEMVRNE